jgi:hypothetical protein
MLVEVLIQCDAGRKALFPGQRYEIPDDIATELVVAGKVREIGARDVLVPKDVRTGRPRRK